jgi:hypothetical protein
MLQTEVVEKIKKAHFVFNNIPPPKKNHAVCEIIWENIVERDRPQMTVWRMRVASWINEATNIHSEYVILTAFLRKQKLRERATEFVLFCF